MRDGSVMTRIPRRVMLTLGALVLGGLTLLSACSTTTTVTENRNSRPVSEPVDPERRARVRLELAGLYFGRGQNSTALDEIKTALAAKPDMFEAYNLRGLVYASMGDALQAEENFLRAMQLAPADGNTMHSYGWFLCQERRFAESETQFEKALAQPQYRDGVRTLLARGVCQARAGRWGEAERTLSRSYELDPSNPVTAFSLSEVLLRRGDLERARFYVRRINAVPDQVSSQSLWLAARIDRRLGNFDALQDHGRQLRDRFPQSPELVLFERGKFDE